MKGTIKLRNLPKSTVRDLISQSSIAVGKLFYGDEQYKAYGITKQIDSALQRLGHEEGDCNRFILNTPPQVGKSCSLSNFMAQYKCKYPNNPIIYVTYNDVRAGKIGQQTKDTFNAVGNYFGLRIDPSARSKTEFDILDENGRKCRGSVVHRGAREGITGYDANLIVIDDLYKGPEDSGSIKYRQMIEDLWYSSIDSRGSEDVIIVLTMTRWHVDDIVGHLSRVEQQESGDKWDKMVVHAIAEEDTYTSWGEKILSAGESPHCRFSHKHYARKKKHISPWVWEALYMQKPKRAYGSLWPETSFTGDMMADFPPHPQLYAIGVDNSTGKDIKKGCDSAIVGIATTGDGKIYVDADITPAGPRETLDRLIRFIKAGPRTPDVIGIENFQFQELIVELGAEMLLEAGINCHVEGVNVSMEHPVTGKKISNPAKEDRIATSLDGLIVKGLVRYAKTKGAAKLIAQLENFPSDSVGMDGPDAFDIAKRALEEYVRTYHLV